MSKSVQSPGNPQPPPRSKLSYLKPSQRTDHELEEFRSLMEPPAVFEDGFSWPAFFGALFIALLMVPGSIYMTLIVGQSVGPAAQWVTVILFIEVARRANRDLKKAEIFTLFYLAGAIMTTGAMAQGQFQGGLGTIWAQFYVQSDSAKAMGIAAQIPNWVAPTDPRVLEQRSLFMWQWLPAVGLIAFTMIIGRIDNMILGYGLFRITSDIEKLPFPMAPVGAQGILALSEEQDEQSRRKNADETPADQPAETGNWRWRVFSIGSVMGLVFGAIYVGLPTITAAMVGTPITILPIPYVDFTTQADAFLKAVPVAVSMDLGQVIFGMVLPFWAVVGTFAGWVMTAIANPILYQYHFLPSWKPTDAVERTFFKNYIDFYLSFGIGLALTIAVVGGWAVWRAMKKFRAERREMDREDTDDLYGAPEGRGDIRWWVIIAVYLLSTALYIGVSIYLLKITDGYVYWPLVGIMIFYALLYTPVISYVTARLEGMAGQVLNIPYVREACFILSGYHGVAVWFLPIPLHNYGSMTVFYRQCELTGTKFWSIWKAEIILMPIILLGSLFFASFIWHLAPIPGPMFLYAQQWWPVTAAAQSVTFSSTLGGYSAFEQALNWHYIAAGFGIGSVMFAALSWVGAPTFLIYGVVRGLNGALPFTILPEFLGALIGRFYFRRKLGLMWRQYIPVVAAGFSCGVGLVATLAVGITFLAKSVFKLPF